jgi:hypothetical protein
MNNDQLLEQTIESVLHLVGYENFLPMSRLLNKPSQSFVFPNALKEYSFLSPDVIFRDDGNIVIEEVNGSNAASSGTLADGVTKRAQHMAETALTRGLPPPCVCLLAHSSTFRLPGEFYSRTYLFALRLSPHYSVAVRNTDEPLGDEEVSVVVGAIPTLARYCEVRGGCLWYKGRKVAFAQNPNLLPELVRLGVLLRDGNGYKVDCGIFHEGAKGVVAVHDRTLQQTLAGNTGFTALQTIEATSWEDARTAVAKLHARGAHAVGKVNAGSQGCGIRFFPAHKATEVEHRLAEIRASANEKYSCADESSLFPLRFFEFAAARRYKMSDGGHLGNLRFETHVSPGRTEVIPNGMRLCPGPFAEATFSLDGVLSNVSGRNHGLKYVRTPFGTHASGKSELEWAGVSLAELEVAAAACAAWAEAAIAYKT